MPTPIDGENKNEVTSGADCMKPVVSVSQNSIAFESMSSSTSSLSSAEGFEDEERKMKGGLHAESTPPSVESPRGGKRAIGKQAMTARRRKQQKPGTPVMPHMQTGPAAGQMVTNYQNQGQGGMFPSGPQQWPPYQQHPPQVYYQQQPQMQQAGNPRVQQVGTKQALSNMLRMRLPASNQYMGQAQPQVQNFQPMQRQQMFRQQMQPPGMQAANQGGQMFPGQQQQQMYPPNMQQQGMNQNYGAYGGGGGAMNAGMFPDQSMMRTPEYQQRMRPPYMQQAPNVTMNSMGGPLSQPAPPYTRPQQQQQQHFNQQQQLNQQRMRQQLMAMQQQQQQQQQQGQAQNSNTIVQQLQRQMQSQQPNQQQHMYQQQPPPY